MRALTNNLLRIRKRINNLCNHIIVIIIKRIKCVSKDIIYILVIYSHSWRIKL